MKLFVYGTLKSNGSNPLSLFGGIYLYTDTLSKYKMYTGGWYPMVIRSDNETDTIKGEIWEVPDTRVQDVDNYEGVPYLYKKEYIKDLDAYIYIYQKEVSHLQRLRDGVWK